MRGRTDRQPIDAVTTTAAVVRVRTGARLRDGCWTLSRPRGGDRGALSPSLPPAAVFAPERTYPGSVGALDGARFEVWAECVFVDPVADVAVLTAPDGQGAFCDECDATTNRLWLTGQCCVLAPSLRGATGEIDVYVLSLDHQWVAGTARWSSPRANLVLADILRHPRRHVRLTDPRG